MRHTPSLPPRTPAGGALPEQSLKERLNDLHPGFERDLADAEAFFTGPGSLEDLHLFFH
ncbi:hypothetical protein ACH4UR_07570 [Streptomyces lydicus]|uniref:hypothetical protein n=1 Tax=Streptomyces lydicus TaxID=47763 RepID=UPI003404F785